MGPFVVVAGGAGVAWEPIDDSAALATLSDEGVTVSLEFRFNQQGEVTSIYSPGRWGRFDGEYRRVAWEGHFDDYQDLAGVRIPFFGEVGWFDDDEWCPVWKGVIRDALYE